MNDDYEDIGYFWFSYVYSEMKSVWEIHACVKPGWEKRWLTREVLSVMVYAPKLMGADFILLIHGDEYLMKQMRRFGFVQTGPVAILDVNGDRYEYWWTSTSDKRAGERARGEEENQSRSKSRRASGSSEATEG
jgi:hypothetical protein